MRHIMHIGVIILFISGVLTSSLAHGLSTEFQTDDDYLAEIYREYHDELAALVDAADNEEDDIETDLQDEETDNTGADAETEEEEKSDDTTDADEEEVNDQSVAQDEDTTDSEEKTTDDTAVETSDDSTAQDEDTTEAEEADAETEEKPVSDTTEEESITEDDTGVTEESSEFSFDENKEKVPDETAKEESEPEIIGIDTVDLTDPAGNWLYKRIWWSRAEDRYEQIKKVFDAVLESRMPFFAKRADVDRKVLDPFYLSVGLDRSELLESIARVNMILANERNEQGSLSTNDRAIQANIIEEKETLERLAQEATLLAEYDDALDEALNKLNEQVNIARKYEKEAWEAFKSIGKELNDKRARELYYGMDSTFKNITDIAQYIDGILRQHYDKVIQVIEEHVHRIQEMMQTLKEKGVDLTQYLEGVESQRAEKQAEDRKQEALETEETSESFLDSIASWFSRMYDSVTGYFGGTTPQEEDTEAGSETLES